MLYMIFFSLISSGAPFIQKLIFTYVVVSIDSDIEYKNISTISFFFRVLWMVFCILRIFPNEMILLWNLIFQLIKSLLKYCRIIHSPLSKNYVNSFKYPLFQKVWEYFRYLKHFSSNSCIRKIQICIQYFDEKLHSILDFEFHVFHISKYFIKSQTCTNITAKILNIWGYVEKENESFNLFTLLRLLSD